MKNYSIFIVFAWALVSSFSGIAQSTTDEKRVYIQIEVKGLACPYCAFGMEKELKKVAGVNEVEIELKEGLAYISTPITQKPSEKALAKIISDAGFTAGAIEYKDTPYTIKKKRKKKS